MFRFFIFYFKYEKGILMHVHNTDLKNEEPLSFEKVQVDVCGKPEAIRSGR